MWDAFSKAPKEVQDEYGMEFVQTGNAFTFTWLQINIDWYEGTKGNLETNFA